MILSTNKFKASGYQKKNPTEYGTRGALSIEAREFIRENAKEMFVEDIAKKIGKSVTTIRKFAYNENLIVKGKEDVETARFIKHRGILRSREYWDEVKRQFNTREIKYFEKTWCKLYGQFDEDVLPGEELQIKKFISMEILHDRCLTRMFQLEQEVDKIKIDLMEEHGKDSKIKNLNAIKDLTIMVEKLEADIIVINKQGLDIAKEQKDSNKQLRMSRDDRVKTSVDATKSFSNAIRALQTTEIMDKVGRHIEIMRAAKLKSEHDLFSYYTFADGSIDRPILSKDSIGEEDGQNSNS